MNITQEEFDTLSAIRNYQDKISQKIREIKSKIYQKDGHLFVTHVYSKDELLQDGAFNTINGIIDNLDNNVKNWGVQNNGYSMYFCNEYGRIRDKIQEDLDSVQEDICRRQPTAWERIKEGFMGAIIFLISKLPKIVLNTVGLSGFVSQKQIGD